MNWTRMIVVHLLIVASCPSLAASQGRQSAPPSTHSQAVTAPVSPSADSPRATLFGQESKFDADRDETLTIDFHSALEDTVDVCVVNPFGPGRVNRVGYPTAVSEALSGIAWEQLVRKVWVKHRVIAGQNTVTWDGKDEQSKLVPAGPYIVSIARTNEDGLAQVGFETLAIVERSSQAPVISEVKASVQAGRWMASWSTNVPTTGAVFYATREMPQRVSASILATNHSSELLGLTPKTDYAYWVIARDAAGHTAVSSRSILSTGAMEQYRDLQLLPVSETAVDASWSSESTGIGRVRYAVVDSPDGPFAWRTAEDLSAGQHHLVHLTDLLANKEYVYRVSCAPASNKEDSSVSPYGSFVTKHSRPSVKITSPSLDSTVEGVVNVVVEASDSAASSSKNGIGAITLLMDASPLDIVPTHKPNSNLYSFAVDTAQFDPGDHFLLVRVTDDFGNENSWRTDITIKRQAR
jgi:hypothetical protein